MKIVIGSRGSELALWQANHIRNILELNGHHIEVKIIITSGDRIQDLGFDKMEGKGFFTKEIEEALIHKEIDLAVHSLKDLETTSPQGLELAAISLREDPSDVLLIGSQTAIRGETVLKLAPNSVVGTSSARRKSQLLALRPDLRIRDLRGNVPTRLKKLRSGEYDAILLAAAGLARLKLDTSDLFVNVLHPTEFIPAPGQGALGLQIRTEDVALKAAIQCVHHSTTAEVVMIEREVLRNLDGGCQLPLGAFCTRNNDEWIVTCSFANSKDLPAIISKHSSKTTDGFGASIAGKLRRG